jgi:hypothetical protein
MTKLYNLAAMKARLAAIDEERNPLVKMIEAVEAYEGTVGETVHVTEAITIRRPPKPRNGAARTVMQITEDVTAELIEQTGAPVPTRRVLDTLKERGLPLPNKNHINVISARLSNSDKFEGRRGFGWWPKGKPWPGEADMLLAVDDAEDMNDVVDLEGEHI